VGENTAGIVIELIQGEGGINPLSDEYIPRGTGIGGSPQCTSGIR